MTVIQPSAELSPKRQEVLREANSWLGTPFHHHARVKGAGVDCGQFLLEVYERVGMMEHKKITGYSPDFHMHRNEEWYVRELSEYCSEIEPPPLPGDIVLYKIGRVFSHGGIIVEWPRIIHSFVGRGVMYADGTQGRMTGHERKFFRPKLFIEEEGGANVSPNQT